MAFWTPKVGDRVQWRDIFGTISDDYWAHRDRFTVQFDDGSESDFGCESLRHIPALAAQPPTEGAMDGEGDRG